MIVEIPYKPRQWQKEVHSATCRFKVIVAHRRSGKTTMCINELIKQALTNPGTRFFYIAPTYRQAKVIAWEELKRFAPMPYVNKLNETELLVRFFNGSVIELKGADNPDSLRGVGLNGVVFDEYSQQPSNIYTEIIRPALADKEGWAIWIGTPKGKNIFYEVFEEANNKDNWQRWLLKASETNIISPTELASARADMDENEYNQEFECSFESIVKGAVYGDEWTKLVQSGRCNPQVAWSRDLPTYSSWDFGIGDATAIGIYQINAAANEVRLIDYYENTNQPLGHYVEWLRAKVYSFVMNFGDPSGNNRNLNTGRSVFEDLASSLMPQNPNGIVLTARRTSEIDKIHDVKKLLPKLWVNSRLTKFVDAITNYHYVWDESRGEYRHEPFHDWSSHAMDQLGYFAVNYQVVPRPLDNVERKLRALRAQQESYL